MSKLRLSLACWNYDRTRALRDGTAQADGIDLNYLNMPVEETFFRMLRHREFDVAEMSLSSYAVSLLKPERPFIAIPVFPSRFFRHSCIYVNSASGIREPKDLMGMRVGLGEFQQTATVWMRGILQHEYDVKLEEIEWYLWTPRPRMEIEPPKRLFLPAGQMLGETRHTSRHLVRLQLVTGVTARQAFEE